MRGESERVIERITHIIPNNTIIPFDITTHKYIFLCVDMHAEAYWML